MHMYSDVWGTISTPDFVVVDSLRESERHRRHCMRGLWRHSFVILTMSTTSAEDDVRYRYFLPHPASRYQKRSLLHQQHDGRIESQSDGHVDQS